MESEEGLNLEGWVLRTIPKAVARIVDFDLFARAHHALAELRKIRDLEFAVLATAQVDEIIRARVAHEMRQRGRREADEVAGIHFVFRIIDQCDGTARQYVDPLLFELMRVVDV
jgi:hypothetical protein